MVDVSDFGGFVIVVVSIGWLIDVKVLINGVIVYLWVSKFFVWLWVLFILLCNEIDDVECGFKDFDWELVKEVVKKLVFVEDCIIFEGYSVVLIEGICSVSLNLVLMLFEDFCEIFDVIF